MLTMQADSTPPKRGRGRPPSGVPRKEQVRKAVEKHRSKARFAGGELVQVEISRGLCWSIREIAEREGVTMKEAITRLLEQGWKKDFMERGGEDPELQAKTAETMIAKWREMHLQSFAEGLD